MADEDRELSAPITLCRSDAFRLALDGIQVFGADVVLRGTPAAKLEDAQRREIIELTRSGKQIELMVPARTYRQKDGHPNLNHMRLKPSKLAAIAKTFAGRPMLVDHRKVQESAIGRIASSELAEAAGGWAEFAQTFHVTTPRGVIGILDGTLSEFSVSWRRKGNAPIMCTAHGVDVLGSKSCYLREDCYPGKSVALDTGKVIAEYEFADAEGVETSGVIGPAVSGTRIEGIRALLAAELGIEPHTRKRTRKMKNFSLLAVALGLPSLTEDDDASAAARIVEDLSAAKEERDTFSAQLAEEQAAHAETKKRLNAALGATVDQLIAKCYATGKLVRTRDAATGKEGPSKREVRLKRIGLTDGIEALEAEIEEMPQLVPVGKIVLTENEAEGGPIPEPARGGGGALESSLNAAAKSLGIDPGELATHATTIGRGRGALTLPKLPTKEG